MGATHQATEDIAITRAWPGITIFVPCDANEAKKYYRIRKYKWACLLKVYKRQNTGYNN